MSADILITMAQHTHYLRRAVPDCSRFPRDEKGRAVTKDCPVCGNGTLQYEGRGEWRCDGLADPENNERELEACTFTHWDGEPYRQPDAVTA